MIYELDGSTQSEIYYYPLLDSKDDIILLLSVMGTTEGWQISASEEWVDELDELGNITDDFIFYKSEDNIYAENKEEGYCVAGKTDVKIKAFRHKSYKTKKDTIDDAIDDFVKTDVACINSIDIKDKYRF